MAIKNPRSILPLPRSWKADDELGFGRRLADFLMKIWNMITGAENGDDNNLVHKTLTEHIAGEKVFEGDIYVKNNTSSPRVCFEAKAVTDYDGNITRPGQTVTAGAMLYLNAADSDTVWTQGRFAFDENSPNTGGTNRTGYHERYLLPQVDINRNSHKDYNIETSKNPVVHIAEEETITGEKTFRAAVNILGAGSRYKQIYFIENNDTNGRSALIRVDAGNNVNQSINRFNFIEWSPKTTADPANTGFYETYRLPAPTRGLAESPDPYDILTTKTVDPTSIVHRTKSSTYASEALTANGDAVVPHVMRAIVSCADDKTATLDAVRNGGLIFIISSAGTDVFLKRGASTYTGKAVHNTGVTVGAISSTHNPMITNNSGRTVYITVID